jgi:hypothetical protein
VSDFIQNLARRGAGLAPIVAVQPPFIPDFGLGPPTKLRRPASRVAGGVGNTGEIPHPIANSSEPVARPSREVGQEAPPIRAAAPEQTPPPARSASLSHPADSYPEPPGSPEPAPDQGRNTQLHAPYSPEQQTSSSAADESWERESWLPDQGKLQPRSEQPVRADPARVSAGPSTSTPKPEVRATSESGSDPVAQSMSADLADSSVSSTSQEPKQRYGPTVRAGAAQRVEEGPSSETKVDVSAGLLAAADSESQPSPDPGPAPVTRGALSEADDSSRGPSTQEAREQSAPITQARTARRTEERSNPEAAETVPDTLQKRSNQEGAETVRLSSTTQPDEPAVKQVASNSASLRPEEPTFGEPATQTQVVPRPTRRPAPAPVASQAAVRPAPVIMPEPARPQALPPLHRPAAAEPDSIQVRIGAVEVRATTPPPAPPPAPVPQGFDDYSAVRSYAGWGRI